ncbi:tetratricopeptide repeat protein [Thermococcus alcaliphilus]|uniref:tetratricopeptide repeat protein n=1 Tax=Thermococcus alcaliphilus TaxID=139207 RepID=UPI002091C72C|nr:tetratricopeptide repeat protein [Thermococcus alcaliphilus]MCO6041242.1 tetratricopeptide repeat protein [Thermococcus alcaliphilus]
MESPLLGLYKERKDVIESLLKRLRDSEMCEDWGNFASVRRRPMLATVIHYLQNYAGYSEGVSLEELKAFLYCMFLAGSHGDLDIIKSMTWCPIEQTLEESIGVEKTADGRYVAKSLGRDRKPTYWNTLEPLCRVAERICKDILNPPNEWVRELLSLSPEFLARSRDMEEYLRELKFEIHFQREQRRKEQRFREITKLVRPEGITVQEFLEKGFSESDLADLKKAYEEAWQREKLLYADGYIKLLTSIAEYYGEKQGSESEDELTRLLYEVFGEVDRDSELVAEHYIKAADVATSVSLIYFPQQNSPEEAERYLKLALELEEKAMELGVVPEYHSITLNNLGTHYYETNRPEEALSVLKKALEYAKTPEEKGLVLHNLALIYADLGMKKEAVSCMVKSLCIHYSTQHELGNASLYDDAISRIIDMTGDSHTDIYALKVALDLIGGNLSLEEARDILEQINREEWPLADALFSMLSGEEYQTPTEAQECEKLLQDVAERLKRSEYD